MERQLDAALPERGASKRPVFTPLGLQVVERARAALASLEAVAETAQSARAPLSGPLRLGILPTIGPFLLPRLMQAIARLFPRLNLWLREDQTERLLDGLEAGRLDVLLLALPCDCGPAETLAIDGGVLAGAAVEVRRLSGDGPVPPARSLALAWRPKSPRAAELRGLAPAIAEALRLM